MHTDAGGMIFSRIFFVQKMSDNVNLYCTNQFKLLRKSCVNML